MDHISMVEAGWMPLNRPSGVSRAVSHPGYLTTMTSGATTGNNANQSQGPCIGTNNAPPPPLVPLRVKRRSDSVRRKAAHNLFKRWSLDSYLKMLSSSDKNGNPSLDDLPSVPHSAPTSAYGETPQYPHQLYFDPNVLHEEVESNYSDGLPSLPVTHSLPSDINRLLTSSASEDGPSRHSSPNCNIDTSNNLYQEDQIGPDGIFARTTGKKYGEKASSKIRSAKQKKSKQKDTQAHRSKSLTQIDCLDNNSDTSMVRRSHELDSAKSEPETSPCSPNSSPNSGGGILLLLPSASPLQSQPNLQQQYSFDEKGKPKQPQKMPSQELFSVTFDQWDEPGHYELLPAAKGVLLGAALQGLLDRRGIDAHNINVYLDSSNTPLSLQFETFRLGGNHLHVRARDSSDFAFITRANSTGSTGAPPANVRVPASRSNSTSASLLGKDKDDKPTKKMSAAGSQRGRRNALMSAEDLVNAEVAFGPIGITDSPWKPTGSQARRPPLARKGGSIFSNPFKTEREKMDVLTDLLNQYSQFGIPELSGLINFHHTSSSDAEHPQDDPFYLEDHWSQFVTNAHELSKRTRNQQDAIWELLHTEVFFIRRLAVITDLFVACLCNLQNECILNEIDTEKMFSNISEIYAANHRFWTDHLSPMLNASRNTHEPLNPTLMKEGFLKFEQIFQAYIRYCIEHQSCLQYVKDRHKDNELFKAYVAWCETRKDCDRLRLVDLLVKPVQRLTKYSLLLKAIHKKTDSEELKNDLIEMNESVEKFVVSVDATMRQRSEQERLSSIIGRIESYDAIDTNNDELDKVLKEHVSLDLTCPMPGCGNQQSRQLLLEGSGLKLRDTSSSKVDVHCFLFTDMLLICKPKKFDRVRVIRQPYVVDRLVLSELRDGSGILAVYLNEYRVATAAFILYSSDSKLWLENIRKAQEMYSEAKNAASVTERQSFGFLKAADEDEDYDFPSRALMLVARSPRSSSHSSLVHSHSGSVDMSDPLSGASGNVQQGVPNTSPVSGRDSQTKACSIELGELRNSSVCSDDLELAKMRSSSVDTRVSVTVTSPRPDRRAFFLKGANNGSTSPGATFPTGNTLSLSVPCLGEIVDARDDLPTIQLPILPSPPINRLTSSLSPRSLQRIAPINAKPPLIKTKNISGLVTHSAPPSEGPSPVHSLEGSFGDCLASAVANQQQQAVVPLTGAVASSDQVQPHPGHHHRPNITGAFSLESEEEINRRLNVKRACRNERRYHTADSIENLKKEKDTSIHKRLSWNYGQQQSQPQSSGQSYHFGGIGGINSPSCCGPSERLLRNKHVAKCLSSESIYSSSGVSSTGSMHLSVGSTDYDGSDILEEPSSYHDSECVDDTMILDGETGESSTDDHIPTMATRHQHQTTMSKGANPRTTRSTLSDPGAVSDVLAAGGHHRQLSDPHHGSTSSSSSRNPPPVPPRNLSVNKIPSNIKIDVSEVKEGISSVQITVNGGAVQHSKPSKDDLKRLKQLLLNSCSVEASEV